MRFSASCRYTTDYTPADRLEPDEYTLGLLYIDEGEGDVLKDASAHKRHGRIFGKVKWVREDELPN